MTPLGFERSGGDYGGPVSATPVEQPGARAIACLDYLAALSGEGSHQEAHVAWHIVQIDVPDAAEQIRAYIDALLARLEAAERERDAYKRAKAENDERFQLERDAALGEGARLRRALEQYANPQHWALDRFDFAAPKAIWIGPGADQRVPDAPGIAREALAQSEGLPS